MTVVRREYAFRMPATSPGRVRTPNAVRAVDLISRHAFASGSVTMPVGLRPAAVSLCHFPVAGLFEPGPQTAGLTEAGYSVKRVPVGIRPAGHPLSLHIATTPKTRVGVRRTSRVDSFFPSMECFFPSVDSRPVVQTPRFTSLMCFLVNPLHQDWVQNTNLSSHRVTRISLHAKRDYTRSVRS
jgi:hypothetical protein